MWAFVKMAPAAILMSYQIVGAPSAHYGIPTNSKHGSSYKKGQNDAYTHINRREQPSLKFEVDFLNNVIFLLYLVSNDR